MGFPDAGMEANNLSINEDLLVWERLLFGVEELHRVFSGLLLLIFIHHSQVVTLRVEEQAEGLSIVEGLYGCLP